jgi:tRNA(fMet)-specific endonuclease VapC
LSYLLDTNTIIYARDGVASVLEKLVRYDGDISLSSLSLAELQRGLFGPNASTDLRKERLEVLLARIPVLAFDAGAAWAYGRIVSQRGWARGRYFDHMIAGHAISEGLTLVTNNEADFAGIPGLALENWVAA